MKKTTIIALIILLIAGLFVACNNETIVDDAFANGGGGGGGTGNYITATTTSIKSGKTWTIQGNVVNNNKITIDGTEETTILLPEGKTLEVKLGIAVLADQTLVIDGKGKLIAGEELPEGGGHQGQAGIGGKDQGYTAGTIIIKGGDIKAYGGWSTAGIGDMMPDTPPASGTAKIEISGGHVEAHGDSYGIGGYKAKILIKNGEIISQPTGNGAGIGGYGCDITISGGTVTATGKGNGAGIGSNDNFVDLPQTITITGGTVEATGGSSDYDRAGAGIGGGEGAPGGTIIISGGIITANGGACESGGGAGIGGGGHLGAGGTVEISGGTVTATGGSSPNTEDDYAGAGIGGGDRGIGGTVTITGGTVTATGGVGNKTMTTAFGIGRGLGGANDGTLELGDGVDLYNGDAASPYVTGPEPNVATRYNIMKVK